MCGFSATPGGKQETGVRTQESENGELVMRTADGGSSLPTIWPNNFHWTLNSQALGCRLLAGQNLTTEILLTNTRVRGLSPQKQETAMHQLALRKTIPGTLILAAILWFTGCNACTSSHLEGT